MLLTTRDDSIQHQCLHYPLIVRSVKENYLCDLFYNCMERTAAREHAVIFRGVVLPSPPKNDCVGGYSSFKFFPCDCI